MAVTPTIYQWPASIIPARAMFYAGGQGIEGGYTTGGVLNVYREAGGRAALEATFSNFGGVNARLISWLTSLVMNGRVFRFPLSRCPQLVSARDLGLSASLEWDGLPWDNDQPFDNDENWAFEPVVEASAAALKGSATLVLDVGDTGEALQHGHVIGHADRAYMVEAIDYDGTEATLTVSPPLRVAVADGDLVTFRPSMLCSVEDPGAFRSMFDVGGIIQPGSLTLREVLI